MICPILKVRFLVMVNIMMVRFSVIIRNPNDNTEIIIYKLKTPPQVVLEQVYWKEKSKDDGVEGDGKALSRKQSLEQSRQNQEKVLTLLLNTGDDKNFSEM